MRQVARSPAEWTWKQVCAYRLDRHLLSGGTALRISRRWRPRGAEGEVADALRSYLRSLGPATPAQFAQWLAGATGGGQRNCSTPSRMSLCRLTFPEQRGGSWRAMPEPRRTTVPAAGWTSGWNPSGSSPRQHRELDDQVDRVAEILQGTADLTVGPVSIGSHL
jgi:hypothetical protein